MGIVYFINKGMQTSSELNYICFWNFMLRSTPAQFGPASSLSAVNYLSRLFE